MKITAATLIRGRFTGLTIVLLTLALVVNAIHDPYIRELLVDLVFSIVVVFAIWTVGRRLRTVTAVLSVFGILCQWSLRVGGTPLSRALVFAFVAAFLAFLTLVILISVFREETVTSDVIMGALCAYFLMGVTWGTAYALVALLSPGAFSVSPTLAAAAQWGVPTTPMTPLMQYYSFGALSTLGAGDITPISGEARTLSVIEAIAGQLYLTILIARLVGIHTARSYKSQ